MASVILAALADLGTVFLWGDTPAPIVLLVLLAGACALVPAWCSCPIGLAEFAVAVLHASGWGAVTTVTKRTFYGGAMFYVAASYTWALVALPILGTTLLGRLVALTRAGRSDPAPEPRCNRCGYLLRGLPQARCPECGTPFDAALLDAAIPPPRSGEHPPPGAQT